MTRLQAKSDEARRIDAALSDWRQGDVALEERWFVHVANPQRALSQASAEADGDLQAVTDEVDGLVLVTQTCDVVRPCTERPFVEVAPLVAIPNADDMQSIRRGRRPAYAAVPTLIDRGLVVHLDRVMTVEKAVVADWIRTPGCTSDAEARDFAQALARKRVRFAFPDDFSALAQKLQKRLQEKHDKQSNEGRGLRALREIRVQASPHWDAPILELFFWFIRNPEQPTFEGEGWDSLLERWLALMPPSGRFAPIAGLVTTLEDLTARDYVESDRLDLDHLSRGRE